MLSRRALLIIILILFIVGVVALGGWWWYGRSTEERVDQAALDAAAQLAAEREQFLSTSERLVLFLSLGENDPTLYAAQAVDQSVLPLTQMYPTLYSNYISGSQHWYSVTNQTITRDGVGGVTTVGTLTQVPVLNNAATTQPSLAVDQAEQYLAYVSRIDFTEEVRMMNFATGQDTQLYQGEPNLHYANLAWSPDGSELAFTVNSTKLVTVTLAGAETYTPINLPFQELSFVSWITFDQIAAVVSSTDTNPEPFQPKIVVLNRRGDVIEEHAVFEKIGVPRVIWSADASQFMFYNPWQNAFLIYNRYDQLIQSLTVAAPGKLIPFGYQAGTGPVMLTPIVSTTDTTAPDTSTSEPFTVTAEDWEHYNTALRNILKQWQIDFSSYRFATTDQGIELAFAVQDDAKAPAELILIQTILQAFAVLPDVPTLTILLSDAAGTMLWEVPAVSSAMVNDVSQQIASRPVEDLFVINAQNPVGKRVVKTDNPEHHYVGDFVYSRYGDYNPYPVLALFGATTPTQQFYATAEYTVLYPSTLTVRTDQERLTLFYNSETTFLSPTAWSGFGVTIKEYDAPTVTVEQWLSVNRPDQVVEAVTFAAREPLTMRHIIPQTEHTDEFIALANDRAYMLTIQRDSGLTDDDRALVQAMAESLSLFYAVQRY